MFPAIVLGYLLNPAHLDTKSPPPSLEIPADKIARVRELIPQLGHPSYKQRARAFWELRQLGRVALPELELALNEEKGTEIRQRCQDLLLEAQAQDFEARLFAFLADTEDKYSHSLPGWQEFRQVTNNHALAREVFTSLLREPDQRELFAALAMPKGEFEQRLIARKVDLYQRMYQSIQIVNGVQTGQRYQPTVLDVVGLLFGDILVGDTMVQGVGVRAATPYTLMIRANSRNAMLNDKEAPGLKALAEGWMNSRTTSVSLSQAISMGKLMGIDNQVPFAVKILEAKGATPNNLAQAICIVAQHGKKEDAKRLAAFLDREEQVYPAINGRAPIQLRDVSLAQILQLQGLKPEEFRFASRNSSETMRYYYYNYSFGTDEERKEGFEAFRKLEPDYFKKKD